MGKILCLCGRIGAGKNTLCNFLHGYQLKAYEAIEDFDLTEDGQLIVAAKDLEGNQVSTLLDLNLKDEPTFAEWAAHNMWPYVKQYGFADNLKQICQGLFGIENHQLYGTHDQKNELTNIRWENMPGVIPIPDSALEMDEIYGILDAHGLANKFHFHKPGFMTAREFMQFFATEVMRGIKDDIWVSSLIKQIVAEDSQLSIITDGRFSNEVSSLKEVGGKTIYLTKFKDQDGHRSESELSIKDCDAFIDNQNLSLVETCQELVKILDGWGWMENTI